MNDIGNLEKRIKRHVLGKNQAFFVSTLPGIEPLCFKELSRLELPMADAGICHGGIAFNGRLHDGYLANLHLRTANRILMRLTHFFASNFRQLEKKLSHIPWTLYLPQQATYTLNITSRHSRLIHTDAIAQRIHTSLSPFLKTEAINEQPEKRPSFQIFVRVENDQFTISIDSSGELLHKRGLKTQGGKAPIRETLAAAILMLAGYQAGDTLIDPMCGTGTFSLEAAMFRHKLPAGWYRDFAFMGWPAFKASRWRHIRREAEKKIISMPGKAMIFASDIDPENSRKLQQVILKNNLLNSVRVESLDFFDLQPQKIPPGLIVLNPPYGLRIKNKYPADKLYAEIGKKLKKDFKGWQSAILSPNKGLIQQLFFKTRTRELFHGGLKITLATGRIQ